MNNRFIKIETTSTTYLYVGCLLHELSWIYRRLNEENNPGGLNEESENATEYVSSQIIADTTQLIEHRHPNQRINNSRSPQLHVTASCPNTINPNHMIENAGAIEENRTVEGGEVVGYIQGYGPVTADPNISAAVIRGKHICITYNNRRHD